MLYFGLIGDKERHVTPENFKVRFVNLQAKNKLGMCIFHKLDSEPANFVRIPKNVKASVVRLEKGSTLCAFFTNLIQRQ